MSWTIEKLRNLVKDQVEESLELEYKSAGALEKNDKKKSEIIKDVSAMANSAGGTIIYGVKEYDAEDKRHLPESIDPVSRVAVSKEWLESIINNAQPRIQGVKIYTIDTEEADNSVVYVVEIPQSFTAHQNPVDKKYYKRYNFSAEPMSDFEIRDIMNRGSRPILEVSFSIESEEKHIITDSFTNRMPGQIRGGPKIDRVAFLNIIVENVGAAYAQHVSGQIKIPHNYISKYWRGEIDADEEGYTVMWFNNIKTIRSGLDVVGEREVPVLPGIRRKVDSIALNPEAVVGDLEGRLEWSVYTENAQPRHGVVNIESISKKIETASYTQDMMGRLSKRQ